MKIRRFFPSLLLGFSLGLSLFQIYSPDRYHLNSDSTDPACSSSTGSSSYSWARPADSATSEFPCPPGESPGLLEFTSTMNLMFLASLAKRRIAAFYRRLSRAYGLPVLICLYIAILLVQYFVSLPIAILAVCIPLLIMNLPADYWISLQQRGWGIYSSFLYILCLLCLDLIYDHNYLYLADYLNSSADSYQAPCVPSTRYELPGFVWTLLTSIGVLTTHSLITHKFDLSVKLKNTERLIELNKINFLASLTHDLRTPLHGLLSTCKILYNDSQLTDSQRESIELIEDNGRSLLAMLQCLLDLNSLTDSKMKLYPSNRDLWYIAEKCVDSLLPLAGAQGLDLFTLIAQKVPRYCRFDSYRLEQILMNLLANAIKFTKKGEILLKIELIEEIPVPTPSARLLFSIRDSGCGISPADQEKLFKKFSQGSANSSNSSNSTGGIGLGLFLCKQLVELMAGRIWVESEIGKGSTFFFEIVLECGQEGNSSIQQMVENYQADEVEKVENRVVEEFSTRAGDEEISCQIPSAETSHVATGPPREPLVLTDSAEPIAQPIALTSPPPPLSARRQLSGGSSSSSSSSAANSSNAPSSASSSSSSSSIPVPPSIFYKFQGDLVQSPAPSEEYLPHRSISAQPNSILSNQLQDSPLLSENGRPRAPLNLPPSPGSRTFAGLSPMAANAPSAEKTMTGANSSPEPELSTADSAMLAALAKEAKFLSHSRGFAAAASPPPAPPLAVLALCRPHNRPVIEEYSKPFPVHLDFSTTLAGPEDAPGLAETLGKSRRWHVIISDLQNLVAAEALLVELEKFYQENERNREKQSVEAKSSAFSGVSQSASAASRRLNALEFSPFSQPSIPLVLLLMQPVEFRRRPIPVDSHSEFLFSHGSRVVTVNFPIQKNQFSSKFKRIFDQFQENHWAAIQQRERGNFTPAAIESPPNQIYSIQTTTKAPPKVQAAHKNSSPAVSHKLFSDRPQLDLLQNSPSVYFHTILTNSQPRTESANSGDSAASPEPLNRAESANNEGASLENPAPPLIRESSEEIMLKQNLEIRTKRLEQAAGLGKFEDSTTPVENSQATAATAIEPLNELFSPRVDPLPLQLNRNLVSTPESRAASEVLMARPAPSFSSAELRGTTNLVASSMKLPVRRLAENASLADIPSTPPLNYSSLAKVGDSAVRQNNGGLPLAGPSHLAASSTNTPASAPRKLARKIHPHAADLLVMVVDDQLINTKIAANMLKLLGVNTERFTSGAAALERLGNAALPRFSHVLTDIHMPEMDGISLCKAIRALAEEILPKKPVIIGFTASPLPELKETCLASGMAFFLAKPCEMEDFQTVLGLKE